MRALHRGEWYVSRYCVECGRELRKYDRRVRDGYWCRCGLQYYSRPDVEVGGQRVAVRHDTRRHAK